MPATRRRRDIPALLSSMPGIALLAGLFLFPVGNLIVKSFTEPETGLANYRKVIHTEAFVNAAWSTFKLSVIAVLVCVVLGTPVAYALANSANNRFLRITLSVLVLSFLTSSLVRAYAWLIILGSQGPVVKLLESAGFNRPQLLFTSTAVVVGMAHYLFPIYILMVYGGLRDIRRDLVVAAEGLGAGHGTALRTVYLPLALPAIVNAGSFVFVVSAGFFVVPALLGSSQDTMLSQVIADAVQKFGDFGVASATGLLLVVVSLVLLTGLRRLFIPRHVRYR